MKTLFGIFCMIMILAGSWFAGVGVAETFINPSMTPIGFILMILLCMVIGCFIGYSGMTLIIKRCFEENK